MLTSKAVLQVFKGLAGLCVALWYDWRVTLVALLVAPVLYHVIRKLGKRIKRHSGAALESQAGPHTPAAECVTGRARVKEPHPQTDACAPGPPPGNARPPGAQSHSSTPRAAENRISTSSAKPWFGPIGSHFVRKA